MRIVKLILIIILIFPVSPVNGKNSYSTPILFETPITSGWGNLRIDTYSFHLQKESEFKMTTESWYFQSYYFYVSVFKGMSENQAISMLSNNPWNKNYMAFTVFDDGNTENIANSDTDKIWESGDYVVIFWVMDNSGFNFNDGVHVNLEFDPINPFYVYGLFLIPFVTILYLEKKHRSLKLDKI